MSDEDHNKTIIPSPDDLGASIPPSGARSDGDIGATLALIQQQLSSLVIGFNALDSKLQIEREARQELERRTQHLSPTGSTTSTPHRQTTLTGVPTVVQIEQSLLPTSTGSASAALTSAGTQSAQEQVSSLPAQPAQATQVQTTPTQVAMLQKLYALPTFSGDPEQWPLFLAAYKQSTEACGYSNLQNLLRLQRSLEGAAKESVRYLLLDPANVTELIDSLAFQYGRPEILVDHQISQIRELMAIPERKFGQIIAYATLVRNMVAFLNTAASRHVLTDTTLLSMLVSKLPDSRMEDWAEYSMTIEPRATAVDFSEWLTRRARRLAGLGIQPAPIALHAAARNGSSGQNSGIQPNQSLRSDKRILMSVANSAPGPGCVICAQPHRLAACQSFARMVTADRWAAARRYQLCFGCLRANHSFNDCRSKQRCPHGGCEHWHHEMLHEAKDSSGPSSPQQQPPNDGRRDERAIGRSTTATAQNNPFHNNNELGNSAIYTCRDTPTNSPILFRVLPVLVKGPEREVETYALLDEGSSITAIDQELAEQLQLKGPQKRLNLQFIGHNESSEMSREVSFGISGIGENPRRFQVQNARTVRQLNLPIQSMQITPADPIHSHLRGLPVIGYQDAVPKVLIGLDHCRLGVATKTRTSADSGIVAMKTPLGWVVFGQQSTPTATGTCLHCHLNPSLEHLEKAVGDYFSTENFGVLTPSRCLESDEDIRARNILQSTTQKLNNRFQTGLLWRTDRVQLPDSRQMALQRFSSVQRKMKKEPLYDAQYRQQITSYLAKGYARKLSPEEARTHDGRTWYLSHFGVRSANKPGKLRLVFDAAASVRGTSLNSALLKGPDLNQPLTKVLFHFRMSPVGICADIAEMFHQVVIRPEDRRAQRFFWESALHGGPPDAYEMCVMTFGASCSPTSAQHIKNQNATEHEAEFPDAARAIRECHYVDDFVCSFPTEDEAIRVTKDVVEVHSRGGFHLRGFVSNSNSVLLALGCVTESKPTIDMRFDAEDGDKILGMRWNTNSDEFVFAIQFSRIPDDVLTGLRPPTKREVLSAAMSVFDPFGFLADFTLQAKLIMQSLWRAGIGWDEHIPHEIQTSWQRWHQEVEKTRLFRIPRCYSAQLQTSKNVQLHIFADASESAFAAVAYWRIEYAEGVKLAFISGKSRCAPLKVLTVPRLELQAAVLAARMYNNITSCHNVNISRLVMWTDSRTVLQWVTSTQRRFKPFVAHRVAEVVDATGPKAWRWLPTEENVADDATRGQDRPHFNPESRWIRGPSFLLEKEARWPTTPTAETVELDGELPEEVRPRFVGIVAPGSIIDFRRFFSYMKLCRTAAWILRFSSNARRKTEHRVFDELSTEEIEKGCIFLCKLAQAEGYSSEILDLQRNGVVDSSSTVRTLMPYIDDKGLVRIYGRTDAAQSRYLSADAKRPILLPRSHRFTEMMVHFQHVQMAHQMEGAVICAVRSRFWVPHLRVLVRKVKRCCQHCRIQATVPIPPVSGQLPSDRLTPFTHPFKFTGMDYFGPVLVTIGKRCEKRWIALFTCLTTRAVHMEVAEDLSTAACLMCIRNFANLRGVPARIRSDCGKNFIGADNELRRIEDFFDMQVIKQELTIRNIDWMFNYPANPEAGGIWERLVQSTKRVLAETLKSVAPRVETLRSLVIEAANILNSRPLTDIPVSPGDLDPLTPNHFLLGRQNSTTTPGPVEPQLMKSRKQWVVCQQMVRSFWRRWVREYLPDLTRRTKAYKDVPPIQVGDLVLVCEASQSRSQWARGRVEETIIGTDGRVRLAKIRTTQGILRRPVSKLARLDVVGETSPAASHGGRDVGERVQPAE